MTTEEKALTPVGAMTALVEKDSVQKQFRNAMADHSDLFVASLIDIFANDTYLQRCAPALVVAEALKAATLKLPINKSLGFAYIVPYNKKKKEGNQWIDQHIPTFQIGYKGYIQLAMRTGTYRHINADVVYEGELKASDKLSGHIDLTGARSSDKIIGYFAYIETLNGFKKTIYSTVADMEKHAKTYSQAYIADKYNKSAWSTNFDAMAKKTMLRGLLSKYGIMSVEMASALSSDSVDTRSQEEKLEDDINMSTGDIIDIDPVKTDDATTPESEAKEPGPEQPADQEEPPPNTGEAMPEKKF